MKVNILAFGIAKDILGYSSDEFVLEEGASIKDLKDDLSNKFPKFNALKKFDIAVNEEYREDNFTLTANDEVAIIPPVSGG